MKAILSDIHGNLEALRVILDEIDRLGVSVVYNLGDTTGYGPNPLECIDLSMDMAVVLLGNFDHAVLFDPFAFPVCAEQCVLWTRQLLQSSHERGVDKRRTDFLSSLQPSYQDAEVLYVHGSPHNPVNEYVFPEDVDNPAKMDRFVGKFKHVCFNGHTHVPGIFVENAPGQWQFVRPSEWDNEFRLDGRRVMCNVGSVGQPRDGDCRTGYVLFDGSTIRFRRMDYDIETTAKKIYGEPALANFYADRIRQGR